MMIILFPSVTDSLWATTLLFQFFLPPEEQVPATPSRGHQEGMMGTHTKDDASQEEVIHMHTGNLTCKYSVLMRWSVGTLTCWYVKLWVLLNRHYHSGLFYLFGWLSYLWVQVSLSHISCSQCWPWTCSVDKNNVEFLIPLPRNRFTDKTCHGCLPDFQDFCRNCYRSVSYNILRK